MSVLVRYQWIGLLTIVVGVSYLVARKHLWIAGFAALASLAWIVATYAFASWAGDFYIEHLVQPAVYFPLVAAVLALPRRSEVWTARTAGQQPHLLCVAALSWFALMGLILVIDMGQEIRERRAVITELLDAAERRGVRKGAISEEAFAETFIGNVKYLPCISLVHAATSGREPIMLRVALPGVQQQFAEAMERTFAGSRRFGSLADEPWMPFHP